jgi:uncharacterized protein
MPEETLTFDSSGLRLAGILTRPESAAQAPRGVILIHGWGGYRIGAHGMLVKMARALAAEGVPALRFDLRGRGDSEGDVESASVDDMIADALAAGAALAEATGVTKLGAIGHCSGGNVALGAAVKDARYDRLVPISTFPFQEHITASHRKAYRRGRLAAVIGKAFSPRTWVKMVRGEVHWGRVAKNVTQGEGTPEDAAGWNLKRSREDIPGMLAGWKGKALFIYGGADAEDEASLAFYKAFAAERGAAFQFAVIDGANHNFYSLEWEAELSRKSVEFMKARDGGA